MPFEVCPICGHREARNWTPVNQSMHIYVDAEKGTVVAVFNDDKETINPSGKRMLMRQDVFEAKKVAGKSKVSVSEVVPK